MKNQHMTNGNRIKATLNLHGRMQQQLPPNVKTESIFTINEHDGRSATPDYENNVSIPTVKFALIFRATRWLLITVALLIGVGSGAESAELLFSNAVGYSSNPVAAPEAQGSALSEHRLWLGEDFRLKDTFDLNIGASVNYQALEAFPDNHLFTLNLTLSSLAPRGRITPYLFSNVTVFRDALIPSDDQNTFTIGAGAEITLDKRFSLIVEPSYKFIDYLESAPLIFLPPMERAGQSPQPSASNIENASNHWLDQAKAQVYDARKEDRFILDTRLDLFLTPTLTASAGLNLEFAHSSMAPESYLQITPSIRMFWAMEDRWQLTMEGHLAAKTYTDMDAMDGYISSFSPTPPGPGNADGGVAPNRDGWCETENGEGCGTVNGERCGNVNGEGIPGVVSNGENRSIDDETITPRIDVTLHFFSSATIDLFMTASMEYGAYPLDGENYTERMIRCGFSWAF